MLQPTPHAPYSPPAPAQHGLLRQLAVGVRARQWWYFLVLPAGGIAAGLWRPLQLEALAALARGAGVAAGCLAFAYGINGLTERHTDVDPRKNPWIGQTPAPGAMATLTLLALATALGAGLGGTLPLVAALISLAAGAVYSLGPRGKRRLVFGTLLNVFIFSPLLLVAPRAEADARALGWTAVFAALLLQNQLIHEQVDQDEDQAAGAITTAAWLGPAGTRFAVALLGLAAIAAAWRWFAGPVAAVLSGAGLTATVAAVGPKEPRVRRRGQRSIALLGGGLAFAVDVWSQTAGRP